MDADQCWQGCCCFSHEEKLAWAAEHGIAVPALASQPAACDVAGRGDGGDCCSEHDGADHHSVAQTESNDDPAPTPWRLVWGSRVLKCQGGSGVWLVIGPALAPPAPFEVSWEATLVAWLTLQDDHSLEVVAGVGSPPPESA